MYNMALKRKNNIEPITVQWPKARHTMQDQEMKARFHSFEKTIKRVAILRNVFICSLVSSLFVRFGPTALSGATVNIQMCVSINRTLCFQQLVHCFPANLVLLIHQFTFSSLCTLFCAFTCHFTIYLLFTTFPLLIHEFTSLLLFTPRFQPFNH